MEFSTLKKCLLRHNFTAETGNILARQTHGLRSTVEGSYSHIRHCTIAIVTVPVPVSGGGTRFQAYNIDMMWFAMQVAAGTTCILVPQRLCVHRQWGRRQRRFVGHCFSTERGFVKPPDGVRDRAAEIIDQTIDCGLDPAVAVGFYEDFVQE